MKEKQIKLPGPNHPISIERNPARVVMSHWEVIQNEAPKAESKSGLPMFGRDSIKP